MKILNEDVMLEGSNTYKVSYKLDGKNHWSTVNASSEQEATQIVSDEITQKYGGTYQYIGTEKITNEDLDGEYFNADWDDDGIDGEPGIGKSFFADGYDWKWFKQVGESVHLDFDNWAVWWAYRPEEEDNPESMAISAFFVVDTDTGFIDWGPCDTVEEAQEFLQSKVDDWENDDIDESVNPIDLTDCPECGGMSFNSRTGRCTKCSYRESLNNNSKSIKEDLEDIEFIVDTYLPDLLVSDTDKPGKYEMCYRGNDSVSVIVEFDPSYSEYVFTIDGEGPHSYSSYEYIQGEIERALDKKLWMNESKSIKEDTHLDDESAKVATNSRGDFLVRASSGHGYTAFNKHNVCIGGITTDDEKEAVNKFKFGKLDEAKYTLDESWFEDINEDVNDGNYLEYDDVDETKYPNLKSAIEHNDVSVVIRNNAYSTEVFDNDSMKEHGIDFANVTRELNQYAKDNGLVDAFRRANMHRARGGFYGMPDNTTNEDWDDDYDYDELGFDPFTDSYDDEWSDEELANIYGGERMYCPHCGSSNYYDGRCYKCNPTTPEEMGESINAKGFNEALGNKFITAFKSDIEKVAVDVITNKLGYESDFANEYIVIDVRKGTFSEGEPAIICEIRTEMDYDDCMTLADELNAVLNKYFNDDPYFDMEDSHTLISYLDPDCLINKDKLSESNSIEEEPYTKEMIEQDLKLITKNFTEKEGELKCGFKEEKDFGVEILKQHYNIVEVSGDDRREGTWYHISYAEPIKEIEEAIAPDGYAPKKVGKAYKVFRVKNGKLYPPMVANPGGADTPVGVWLTAEEGEFAGLSKTGRPQVKSTGSGTLSYRPGWHLGDIPRASQFDRTNKETGEKEFPKDFVWAECDYTMDVDYQPESDEQGYMRMGKDGKPYRSDKYQHSLAGLPKLPKDGYYKYRTNPRPDTVPWVITGAIKVNKLLSDAEVNDILAKHGIDPIHRQGGDKTLAELGL